MLKEDVVLQRKKPRQGRSRFTVDAIIQAAAHILVTDGYATFNTNRVAEVAGVSIGSLYQYFPNKQSLIVALWEDHSNQLREFTIGRLKEVGHLPLRDVMYEMILGSIKAHQIDPDLHRVLSNDVPPLDITHLDKHAKETSLVEFEKFLISKKDECRPDVDFNMAVILIHKLVENITHAAVIDEPELLYKEHLVDEVTRMVMAYLE